jgi:hypothetical protein
MRSARLFGHSVVGVKHPVRVDHRERQRGWLVLRGNFEAEMEMQVPCRDSRHVSRLDLPLRRR